MISSDSTKKLFYQLLLLTQTINVVSRRGRSVLVVRVIAGTRKEPSTLDSIIRVGGVVYNPMNTLGQIEELRVDAVFSDGNWS